ncbi:MAG: LPS assembly protein LptD [Desulfobacteraceae bacterium]|nr:LPS assembly protein LptD [Desulfobacteraceae bacterium]
MLLSFKAVPFVLSENRGRRRMRGRGGRADCPGRIHAVFPVLFCILSVFLIAAVPLTSHGDSSPGQPKFDSGLITDAGRNPWNLEAERLTFDQERQIYEAEGSVRVSSVDRLILADYASVDMQTRRVELWGNVTVQYGRNWLKGQHATWNLDSETGWLDEGIVFFAENNFFVRGRSIAKTGATQFELKEGFLTSCDPSDPDWRIQYKEMKVDVGGVAWAKNTSVWARNIPIAYTPIMGVPVEIARKSGFLLPWGGHSTLNGIDFELPLYLAIRDDMDATLFGHYFQNRGFMAGAEYRINHQSLGKGVWAFNFIEDQADKQALLDHGYPFQAEDRFWARGKHDLKLPWQIEAKFDLDYVSDRNFLQEFSRGSSSFGHSEKLFRDYFGRGILYDQTSLVRESSIYLEKRGESSLFSLDARYWQQLDDTLESTTVQKLPALSFTVLPKSLNDTPLYYSFQSSMVNYWREEGDREGKLDIYPRAYLPLHWKNYLDIEPSVGFRSSSYAVSWADYKNYDTLNERLLSDVRVDLSTRLNRVYPVDIGGYTAIQHAFRPEIGYEYSEQSVHGNIPHIDRLDEDQARNGIRYGFSTFLTTKEMKADAQGNLVPSYREWARLRVFQFYNVEKPPLTDNWFDTDIMKEGFSPVGLRLAVQPKQYITLSYDVDLDYKSTGQGNSHDLYMILDSSKGHLLRVDFQQRAQMALNEITTEAFLKTYKNIYLNTYHDYSLDEGYLFKQGYGVRFYRGCWGIGVAYEHEGSDDRVIVSVDLLGLGSLGRMPFLGRAQYSDSRSDFQRPESWALAR